MSDDPQPVDHTPFRPGELQEFLDHLDVVLNTGVMVNAQHPLVTLLRQARTNLGRLTSAHGLLRQLARFGALVLHENVFDPAVNIDNDHTRGHENHGGSSYGFDTCPHPDCVLVRSAS
jgi:hypothetical protein